MKTKIQLFTILGMLLTGCSVAHLQYNDSVQIYPPSNYENIEVYSTEQTGKSYIIIGEVVASVEDFSDGDGSGSVKYLKKEASKLGADGIINLKLEISEGILSNAVTSSGTAVKFIN